MSKLSGNSSRSGIGANKGDNQRVRRLCTEKPTPKTLQLKQTKRPSSRGAESSWNVSARSTPARLTRSSSLTVITPKSTQGESSISGISCEVFDDLCKQDGHVSRQDLLRWKVLYSFSKNLCKKRKNQINLFSNQCEKSEETISKLSIQVSLLKSIIRSDETIRETWKKRLQDVKEVLTSSLDENNRLKHDFEEMDQCVVQLKDRINRLETENKNYKNTEILLKSECTAFEQQLKKERDAVSQLKYENQIQIKTLNKEMDKKTHENKLLQNKVDEYEMELVDKSYVLNDLESSLHNTTRLLKNSINEIQQLNKEAADLRRTNQLLRDEMISVRKSMTLLENNQQEIYKYFNATID